MAIEKLREQLGGSLIVHIVHYFKKGRMKN